MSGIIDREWQVGDSVWLVFVDCTVLTSLEIQPVHCEGDQPWVILSAEVTIKFQSSLMNGIHLPSCKLCHCCKCALSVCENEQK